MRFDIYRNLHKQCFSVRYKGKVIAHTNFCMLEDVSLVVSQAGRQRVLRTKQKNVHAFIRGKVKNDWTIDRELYYIRYNPYRWNSFVLDNEQPIFYSPLVLCVKHEGKFLIMGAYDAGLER